MKLWWTSFNFKSFKENLHHLYSLSVCHGKFKQSIYCFLQAENEKLLSLGVKVEHHKLFLDLYQNCPLFHRTHVTLMQCWIQGTQSSTRRQLPMNICSRPKMAGLTTTATLQLGNNFIITKCGHTIQNVHACVQKLLCVTDRLYKP